MFLSHCLLLLLCLSFCKWQECVLWLKRYCISCFFQICFLKSPLTALIVTGFCCFSSETRLYKKHTETGKNKLCECSMDGCVLNLYSHCKIKTACLDRCYVNAFFFIIPEPSREHVRTWQVSLKALQTFKMQTQGYFKKTYSISKGTLDKRHFMHHKLTPCCCKMGIKI